MDEYQLSCPKSMFKIHKYKTEEEAKETKRSKSGSPSHVGNEYWVADENILSTIFDQSMDLISQMFKLNVEFGVEWQVGTNWRKLPLIRKFHGRNLERYSNAYWNISSFKSW